MLEESWDQVEDIKIWTLLLTSNTQKPFSRTSETGLLCELPSNLYKWGEWGYSLFVLAPWGARQSQPVIKAKN